MPEMLTNDTEDVTVPETVRRYAALVLAIVARTEVSARTLTPPDFGGTVEAGLEVEPWHLTTQYDS